jgi:acyl-coenzyme A thioesterase PaaI-like protein
MFARSSQLIPQSADGAVVRFRAEADETWLQGRSLFGGLQLAWLARAGAVVAGEDRALRTLHAQLLAPVPAGSVTVAATVLRAGSRVSTVRAWLEVGDAVVAEALATFARGWDGGLVHDVPAAAVPPSLDAWRPLPRVPGLPSFLQHVDLRMPAGAAPYQGGRAEVAGFARFHEGGPWDAVHAVGVFDVLPPAALMAVRGVTPAATADVTVDLVGPLPASSSDHVWISGAAQGGGRGLIAQRSGMWTTSGQLVGWMRQLVAVVPG